MKPCSSHLDAAMPLFNFRILDDEFFCGSGTEVVGDLGFERWLVAFKGEQVVSLVLNDLVGDGDLTAHGVDGHQRSFELFGFGQMVEKFRNGRDFIGFLRHAELSQDKLGIGRIGAQGMERLEPFALVVGAARRLAVDGNQIVPVRPEFLDPALKTARE